MRKLRLKSYFPLHLTRVLVFSPCNENIAQTAATRHVAKKKKKKKKKEGLKTFQRYVTNPLCFTRAPVCIRHYPGMILPVTVHIMARTEHCPALFGFALPRGELLIPRILSPQRYRSSTRKQNFIVLILSGGSGPLAELSSLRKRDVQGLK